MLGLLLLGTATAILASLYAPVVRDLASVWSDDPNYSHGFIVPVVSAALVWRRRAEIAAAPGKASALGALGRPVHAGCVKKPVG